MSTLVSSIPHCGIGGNGHIEILDLCPLRCFGWLLLQVQKVGDMLSGLESCPVWQHQIHKRARPCKSWILDIPILVCVDIIHCILVCLSKLLSNGSAKFTCGRWTGPALKSQHLTAEIQNGVFAFVALLQRNLRREGQDKSNHIGIISIMYQSFWTILNIISWTCSPKELAPQRICLKGTAVTADHLPIWSSNISALLCPAPWGPSITDRGRPLAEDQQLTCKTLQLFPALVQPGSFTLLPPSLPEDWNIYILYTATDLCIYITLYNQLHLIAGTYPKNSRSTSNIVVSHDGDHQQPQTSACRWAPEVA